MSDLPTDLVPIPTSPWDERPVEHPLDVQECRTALWAKRGNVTEAAELLKVAPMRLRRFINGSAFLMAEMAEANEQLKDKAVKVIHEALEDTQDHGRQDSMARFVMSSIGKDRGFGSNGNGITIPGGSKGSIHITWGDGEEMLTAEPETIDVTPTKVASNG